MAADTTVTQTVAAGTAEITFSLVNPDTYSYSVGAVDASGNALGTSVTGSFVITAPATITLNLPASVVASQS